MRALHASPPPPRPPSALSALISSSAALPRPRHRAPSGRAPRVAANFRLKAVTTASLKGSLCISRGQGRRGRPQPSVSSYNA
ncbi:MAG: hypothetical protein ACI30W_05800 [Muribaculaceae bacterium]